MSPVHPGTAQDVPMLGRIAREAYAPYVSAIGFEPPPMLQDFAAAVDQVRVWVIGTPPQGYVVAYSDGPDWHIENVAVAASAQGQGIGGRLIRFAEAEGAARGHGRVTLYTNVHMAPNLEIYPAMGYSVTERRTVNGLERVYFEKPLV